MTQHWGTDINPAFFVEVPDPANPGQTKRPDAGTTLMVQSAPDQVTLASITIGTYGYWQYSLADDSVNAINVSSDSGVTWVGPLYSRESGESQANSGTAASQALQAANQAATTVGTFNARITSLETSGVGGGGGGPTSSAGITDATSIGRTVLTAPDATTARNALGAGTSSLGLGTTAGTAKAGDYAPTVAQVSDASTVGRTLMKVADAAAARTALSLDQVNNTSDANKPVSSATAAALAGKQPIIPNFATEAAGDAAIAAGTIPDGSLYTVG